MESPTLIFLFTLEFYDAQVKTKGRLKDWVLFTLEVQNFIRQWLSEPKVAVNLNAV